MARRGEAWQGLVVRAGGTHVGFESRTSTQCKARCGKARCGSARRGAAGVLVGRMVATGVRLPSVHAWHGEARQGPARPGKAGLGKARD